ncbi:UDP-N-acetylmuramoyl-tripeptide--D-alanyl-D-alanine ligase [bacterium A37T11]|nr:UDP-N-acetylmuramoyl-tripeptide--D-alanyl-D-alanine ligase [bacterium A37T11]
MEIAELYTLFKRHPAISTDTRNITPDSLFFALKGANFNGNAFAVRALEAGAAYAVVDEPVCPTNKRIVVVRDVLTALQDLARYHRRQLTIPVIGITGTNGKTTSKELLYAVLSQRYQAFATHGNLNNHIGVPLSVLSIGPEIEMAIIEMGANHLGEIALLCSIAQPSHGLITNVGRAHLEGFGSFEGVKKTKAELYDWLSTHQGTLFLQHDNELLLEMAAKRNFKQRVTYGFKKDNRISGEIIASGPLLNLRWQEHGQAGSYEVQTQLTGAYNAENVLAAICAGRHFDLSPENINAGIRSYKPKNNRSQLTFTETNTLICDFYNANASSMAAALENVTLMPSAQKVVILGDMFELGNDSFEEHRKIVQIVAEMSLGTKIFVGKEFYKQKNPSAEFYETTDELMKKLKDQPIRHSLVLLKASRGMAFEKLVPYF